MLTRRFHLSGLFAVLLALMAQLGAGAAVPRLDPIAGAAVLCHDDGETPFQPPAHTTDCLICPLCAPPHVQTAILTPEAPVLPPPAIIAVVRTELPPPSTAPPSPHRPPSQPRAPPTAS
ncbi:MAG TPA: hypothetical protein DDZ81_17255 [Acetobacteraceae bacterium]|jgi:hypothetical protein|nr:hypothetical protein [Acetobacteraceae bacterium]